MTQFVHLHYEYTIKSRDLNPLLFNITCNDISVLYMTAYRCAGGLKKKLNLWSGSQRHRHFVGFLNVPVQAPTRDHPFIRLFRETARFSRLLRHAGDTEGIFSTYHTCSQVEQNNNFKKDKTFYFLPSC